MIEVVVIEREYGSGGAAISCAVAAELGWSHWDREINAEIARRVNCDLKAVERLEDRRDPVYHRLLRAFMRGSFESSLTSGRLEMLDSERLARLFEQIIVEIADRRKCVVVGRGAAWFLRDRPEVFAAFLYAPREERIRRTLAQGKSQAEAEDLVETVDRERAAFVKKYYGKDWPDRNLYNVMLNTRSGDAVAVRTILDQIELLDIQAKPAAHN